MPVVKVTCNAAIARKSLDHFGVGANIDRILSESLSVFYCTLLTFY